MYGALSDPKVYEVVTIREDVHIPGTKKKKINIPRKVRKYSDLLSEDQIAETEREYDPDSIPCNHEAEFTHHPTWNLAGTFFDAFLIKTCN